MRSRIHAVVLAASLSLVLLGPPVGLPRPAEAREKVLVAKRGAAKDGPATQPATQPATKPTTAPAASRPTTSPIAAKVKTLADARALYRKGNYAAAAGEYEKLVAQKSIQVAAAVGLADTLAMQGKYDKATDALHSVAEAGKDHAEWHVATAEMLAVVGQYDKALAHAVEAHTLRPTWARAILLRGQLLEVLGRKTEAIAVYASMAKVVENDDYLSDPEQLVALGKIMDRHSVLTGKKASQQADNISNNYLRKAYLDVDEKYWPAYVAAGDFAMAKHRPKTAGHEYDLAHKINQRIPAAHVGLGVVQLASRRFEQCMKHADGALRINPHYADAFLLKAATYMHWRKFDQVAPLLEKVLQTNPNHLDALSLMAALHVRTFDPDKAKPYLDKVEKISPGNADVHNTIGVWLAAGRQFEAAEKYYRRAMELAPEQAEPVTNLGLLYMQTGEEDKARETLKKAHGIDDFRADVANYLNILRKLERFQVRETEHFIVKVDPRRDAVLLDQVCEYMEEIYEEICGDYAFHPTKKTMVEIFPTQVQFSERISGRGWIPTVGACTGRVIVLTAPAPEKQRTPLGTHNWAVVLRHEFTHVVTLTGTRNRIPHWFTEACAVWQQPDKRSYTNVKLLADATRGGRLLPVKDLDWGFIRPKSGRQRALAYAQSEWIKEYIITTKGYETIIRMLEAFRDGTGQSEVFEKIVGRTEEAFDKEFKIWATEQVGNWGYSTDPTPDLKKATEEAKKKPQDADAQAKLAVAQYCRRQMKPAERSARKALKIDPDHPKALAVLARVLSRNKKYDEAIAVAQKLDSVHDRSVTAPRVLAECCLAKRGHENYAKAIAALELLKQRAPYDQYPYDQLVNLYTRLGMAEKALPNLIHLHRHTMKDPGYAKQAAEIYRLRGQDDLALKFYQEVLYINPYDASVYDAVAAIHRKSQDYGEAIGAIRNLTLLAPTDADSWNKLALCQYRAWQAAKDPDKDLLYEARRAAQKGMDLDPNSQAVQILELIDEALKN